MALPGNGTILATSADRKLLYDNALEAGRRDGQGLRQAGRGARPAAPRDRHRRGVRQRDDPRHGDGRQHEHRAAHPGHRLRGGRAVHARPDRRAVPQDAEHLQGRAVEQLSHRGRRPRRGHPHDPRRDRPRPAGPARPRLADRHRQDAGREHRRVRHPLRQGRRTRPAPEPRPPRRRAVDARPGPCRASLRRARPSAALDVLEAEGEESDTPGSNGTRRRRLRPVRRDPRRASTPIRRRAAWRSSAATSRPTAPS